MLFHDFTSNNFDKFKCWINCDIFFFVFNSDFPFHTAYQSEQSEYAAFNYRCFGSFKRRLRRRDADTVLLMYFNIPRANATKAYASVNRQLVFFLAAEESFSALGSASVSLVAVAKFFCGTVRRKGNYVLYKFSFFNFMEVFF